MNWERAKTGHDLVAGKRAPTRPIGRNRKYAVQLVSYCQEARIGTLRLSWGIRSETRTLSRIAKVAAVAIFSVKRLRRRAISYAVSGRLRSHWRVIGAGKEQIVCASQREPDTAVKIIYGLTAPKASELDPSLEYFVWMAHRVQEALGEFNAFTSYSIDRLDDAGQRYGIVGRQRHLTVLDSVFHHGGVLSPLGSEIPPVVRRELATRLQRLQNEHEYVMDLVGFGNLVIVAERDHPVLIDNIPLDPALDPVYANVVGERIATLHRSA